MRSIQDVGLGRLPVDYRQMAQDPFLRLLTEPPKFEKRERNALSRGAASTREMIVCPDCSDFTIRPDEYVQTGPSSRAYSLECVSCGWWGMGSYERPEYLDFELALEIQEEQMQKALPLTDYIRLVDWCECFVNALDVDYVSPEDFGGSNGR